MNNHFLESVGGEKMEMFTNMKKIQPERKGRIFEKKINLFCGNDELEKNH